MDHNRLTQVQMSWLLKAEEGRKYTFYSDVAGWRDVGGPLMKMRLIQWVANPRETAVILTYNGAAVRDELKRTLAGIETGTADTPKSESVPKG